MRRKEHWENIYSTRAPHEVGWFQRRAATSLRFIRATGVDRSAAIIDVGGGASVLVDDLLAEGYRNVTVLDLSGAALAAARRRLGMAAERVGWIEADVTKAELPALGYDVWHDRAVFHFLTDPVDRAAYVAQMLRAVKPGGHVIVACFAEDGPEQCSGLPVVRYSPEGMHAQFGDAFILEGHDKEAHQTPGGAVQQFVYCYCRKAGA